MSKSMIFSLQFGFFLLIPAIFLYAEPTLKSNLSSLTIQENQTAILTLTIDWPKDEGAYQFAVPDLPLKNLVLERVGESQESFQQNQVLWTSKSFEFELKAEKPGEGKVGEFRITFIDAANGMPRSLVVPEQTVQISPHRLKSQNKLLIIFISSLAGGSLLLFLFFHKREKVRAKSKLVSELERQISELETFAEQNDNRLDHAVLFELVHKFRNFLMNYYKIPQNKATDAELFQEIIKQDLSSEERVFLRKLSDELAQMKYAHTDVPIPELRGIKYRILQFVRSKRIHEIETAT